MRREPITASSAVPSVTHTRADISTPVPWAKNVRIVSQSVAAVRPEPSAIKIRLPSVCARRFHTDMCVSVRLNKHERLCECVRGYTVRGTR